MASPLFAGGFIWAYVDEAVRRTDLGGILDSDGENGPDGVMDPYRQPEASFYTIREIWSPVYIDRLHITPHFDGRIAVENHWLFTHLSECSMTYQITSQDGTPIEQGPVTLPDLAPGERSFAQIPVSANFRKGDILKLQAYDANHQVICSWSAPIHRAEEQLLTATANERKDLQVSFSEQGLLTSIRVNGKEINLHDGPLPVGMLADCYKKEQRTGINGEKITTFWYRGGIDSIQWTETTDGRLLMDAVLLNDERGHGYKGSFLTAEGGWQIGLTFDYPEQIFTEATTDEARSVTWLGRGPYRVWRNRLKGQQFGLWQKAYNNTLTGRYGSATPPVYPEFKGYHADVRWMQFPDFKVTSLTEALYVRLYAPEDATDQTAHDLSFLLSIPPMQSYKPLEQLGPHAQPDVIRIKQGDEGFHLRLLFDF